MFLLMYILKHIQTLSAIHSHAEHAQTKQLQLTSLSRPLTVEALMCIYRPREPIVDGQ